MEEQRNRPNLPHAPVPQAYKASCLASASLPLALLSLVLLFNSIGLVDMALAIVIASIALVLGGIGIIEVMRSPRRKKGYGYAIPGFLISLVVLLCSGGPYRSAQISARGHEKAGSVICISNLKQLSLAMLQYCDDNEGRFPPPAAWNDAVGSRVKDSAIFICIKAGDRGTPSYAMNIKLKGLSGGDVKSPDKTVMLFESVSGKNQSGGPELLPSPPRHGKVNIVGFADGHVELVTGSEAKGLNWDPGLRDAPR